MGYVAAAPDLFDGAVAKDRSEAVNLSKSISTEFSTQLLTSALEFVDLGALVDFSTIGIHGFSAEPKQ